MKRSSNDGALPAARPPMPALLKPQEAAELLQVSERTLWSMKTSGEIPHVRIRSVVRYAVADLQEWIEARTVRGRDHGA